MLASPMTAYVGVMSGTSLDAIDAVLVHLDAGGHGTAVEGASLALPEALRSDLLALQRPGHDELARAAAASNELATLYAEAVARLLHRSRTAASAVAAIGVHGQTVRHRPELGYTIQLNAPARVAELTGIDVIADFRSRDIAAGGQGAPLVPAFHAAQFASAGIRVVLNLGGIANITILEPDGGIRGFDTGPANMLMDAWIQRTLRQDYDANGAWAASGTPVPELVALMLDDPWFQLPPPKSTGRDDFNMEWLEQRLARHRESGAPATSAVDVQASLLELTAQSVSRAIMEHAPQAADVLVCGGGAKNARLMSALQAALPCAVDSTDAHGLPAQWVEAAAFAWLAWCHDARVPAGLPDVTGARKPTVLGCRYVA